MRYERRPIRPLRKRALRQMERWILEHQEPDGCWGGIQPPWVYSIMALTLRGYPLDHPVVKKAIDGLDGFTIVDEQGRRLEACQSPVWDTCLALIALSDGGLPSDHPALTRAARWLVSEEITIHGDWAVKKPDLAPGGWAFEFENDWYPDIDDTAEVVMALRRVEQDGGIAGAAERGAAWTLGMQSRNGAWGAFDADNTRGLVGRLPFCDFGEVTDPPSVDVTAHVVEMLAKEGLTDHPDVRRGIDYLLREQEADGSWFGRWGANYVYGTGAAVPALVEAGHPARARVDPPRRRLARARPERRRRLGRGSPLVRRPGLERPRRVDRVADGLGPARPPRRRRARRVRPAWSRLARADAASRRRLGRAVVHRHRLSRRLLHQLPPLPARLPGQRARPLRARGRAMSLTVLAPLGLEARALRRGLSGLDVDIVRTGMGPARSRAAAARHGRRPGGGGPLAVAGVCGGVAPGLRAGDVVVATALRTEDGVERELPGAAVLASAVRKLGLRCVTGTILSVERLHRDARAGGARRGRGRRSRHGIGVARRGGRGPGVRGAARRRRRRAAAASTGRERWWTAPRRSRRFAARPRRSRNGPSRPAPGPCCSRGPRSFCAGVERAIEVVERALDQRGAPIYVRKQIVHNVHVVGELEQRGAVFVEELDEVPDGATVVFSAHGVSPQVKATAATRGLDVIDATCPLVNKVHAEARSFAKRGKTIVLVGHDGHEEVEGTMGEAPGSITLVETLDDLDSAADRRSGADRVPDPDDALGR